MRVFFSGGVDVQQMDDGSRGDGVVSDVVVDDAPQQADRARLVLQVADNIGPRDEIVPDLDNGLPARVVRWSRSSNGKAISGNGTYQRRESITRGAAARPRDAEAQGGPV